MTKQTRPSENVIANNLGVAAYTAPPKPEQTIELTLQAPIGSAVHWKTLGGKEYVGKLIEWDSNVAIVKTEQGVKAVEC